MALTRAGLTVAAGLAAMVLGTGAAMAAPGYVTTSLNLRAGPGTYYPAVVVMRAGDPVEIYGCLYGWSWCDINWHGYRGWAAGRYLQVLYQRHRRPIVGYGAYFSIPFLSFSIGNYWNQHYRSRSFYNQMKKFGGPPSPPGIGYPPAVKAPLPRLQGPPGGGQPFIKGPQQGAPLIYKGPPQGGPPPGAGFQSAPPPGPPPPPPPQQSIIQGPAGGMPQGLPPPGPPGGLRPPLAPPGGLPPLCPPPLRFVNGACVP